MNRKNRKLALALATPATAFTSPRSRRANRLTRAAIGEFEEFPHYRLRDASTATLLASAICPINADEFIPSAIEQCADELGV